MNFITYPPVGRVLYPGRVAGRLLLGGWKSGRIGGLPRFFSSRHESNLDLGSSTERRVRLLEAIASGKMDGMLVANRSVLERWVVRWLGFGETLDDSCVCVWRGRVAV